MGRAPAPELMACGLDAVPASTRLAMPCRMAAMPEQVVGQVKIPVDLQVFGGNEAGAFAIHADVFGFRGNPEAGHIESTNSPERARRDVPGHAVVAEVGQRVTQGGEFPVQHRQHPRLGGVEHQVVEPVVAVNDADQRLIARLCGDVRRQPFHELIHLGDGLGDGGHVLLAPAADLPLEIVAGFAVSGQPPFGKLDRVQRSNDAVHLVVDRAALARDHARQ